jgi:U6 snRNA-associated Sm-like protein LSm7
LPKGFRSLTCCIATGCLKGYDALMNLVLDDVKEVVRGMFLKIPSRRRLRLYVNRWLTCGPPDDEGNESTRSLGLVVARGTLLVLISPEDGSEVIANPFVNEDSD